MMNPSSLLRSKRLSSSGQGFLDDLIKTYPLEEKYQEFRSTITGKATMDKARAFVKVAVLEAYRNELKVCARTRNRPHLHKTHTYKHDRHDNDFILHSTLMVWSCLNRSLTVVRRRLLPR